MNASTETRIKTLAEHIYRVANFAPDDRTSPLSAIDHIGLMETEKAVRIALLEQDRITRHACAEAALLSLPRGHRTDPVAIEVTQIAHQACMNVNAV